MGKTYRELLEYLKMLETQESPLLDTPILITTSDVSIGARACVGVRGFVAGFDWEYGQLRLDPIERVFKK